jgi:RimJ/RimL family protein N-acetyltransferase
MTEPRTIALDERVQLAPLTLDHAAAMARWMDDPVVSRNLGLRSAPSFEKTCAWIERAQTDATVYARAALLDQVHVGNVVLDQIDAYLGSARLSIYIGEAAARHAGVGRTALYRLLREGFERLSLHKIWLTVHCEHQPAITLYTRLGFTLEGVHRDEFRLDGRRVNLWYMGMLHDDFKRLAIAERSA